ncbi:Nif3-like dinuclear metal center hexameric protein [Seleniivibrio woodruffii]|uniref:Nif3-like dinuclear metal center hexameric protein n=1 Tax=Seleniivibrio woodruffii TaxID=1078050 RepID=UPI00240A2983|nr:Nif3-like dinuclear metal center hexameric protein [Seleniivibrio woodruffii]
MTKVRDLRNYLEKAIADKSRQYDWDNSGNQIVPDDREITKAAFALDPTDKVINKAIEEGCEVLITHHPLFFGSLKSLCFDRPFDRKVIKAIQNGLSILSHHTSLDLADYSLNDHLCSLLNGKVEEIFVTEGHKEMVKFIVFVPVTHSQQVRKAMAEAGAGNIGNYSDVSFSAEGTGRFKPCEGAKPFIGSLGEIEEVAEHRIETIIEKSKVKNLINKVVEAHPYEEVAYDVYPLEGGAEYGLGRIASFETPMPLSGFLDKVRFALGSDTLRINTADLSARVKRFAVVTGSGASMWKKCVGRADVLVTGDMKHHEALDAQEAGIVIVDAGHFHTERIFMKYLAEKIGNEFNINTVLIDEQPPIINWR